MFTKKTKGYNEIVKGVKVIHLKETEKIDSLIINQAVRFKDETEERNWIHFDTRVNFLGLDYPSNVKLVKTESELIQRIELPIGWTAIATTNADRLNTIFLLDENQVLRETLNRLGDTRFFEPNPIPRYAVRVKAAKNNRFFAQVLDNKKHINEQPKVLTNTTMKCNDIHSVRAGEILLSMYPEANDHFAYWK